MDKMIYCQNDIPKDKLRYGLRSSASTGCGWIAAYNALRIMGYKPSPERVIEYFEKQVPVLNGNTGTFIFTPALFFSSLGFSVKTSINRNQFDVIAADCDAVILYYWWRKGLRIGAHFAAVKKDGRLYTGYNTYSNSKGPDLWGTSINEFLTKRGYFGRMITGIKKK